MEKTKVTKIAEYKEIEEAKEVRKTIEEYRKDVENCKINKFIPLDKTLEFVNGVVETCFDIEDEFRAELLDFAFKYYVLIYYTDMELPKEIESSYELVYVTDIVDFVTSKVCKEQLDMLRSAIDKKIECKIADIRYSGQREIDRIKDSLEELLVQMKTMFDGLNPDDFEKFFNAISESGAIDEEKIVKAVLANKDK